jgi:molybdate transport system ATP-binding protein
MTLAVHLAKRLPSGFTLDVSFLAEGGVTILFGASGSGKTTILRCVAGLARPDGGRVAIGDRALFSGDTGIDVPAPRRRIGYVFQQLALFPHLTVAQNIGYGLASLSRTDRRTRVAEAAESFRIAGLLDRRPRQISGGEQQRTALARALVTNPDALLLDEPLSALDYAIQLHIMDDLRRWNAERRIPILYVTHSHREAFALGERLIALEHGRILASGSPHDVLDHPAQATLAELAGFENVFDATVVARRERAGTMHCVLTGSATEIEVPIGAAQGAAVRVAIRAGDILLADREPVGLSARNVFRGTVLDCGMHGSTVVATIDADARFVVHLTPGGADTLGLRPGARVWLIIKTYSCRVATPAPARVQ